MNYTLIDGVQRHAEYPDTFEIPDSWSKSEIVPGDFVKVGFETPDGSGERMWVRVVTATRFRITGVLDNNPILFDEGVLKLGDTVEFGNEHVLSIMKARS